MAGISPTTKRAKLDSPLVQQKPLALPGGVGGSNNGWKSSTNSSSNPSTNNNLMNNSNSLQLTSSSSSSNLITGGNKLGLVSGISNPNDANSPSTTEDNRPSASGSGTATSGPINNASTNTNIQTDFDAMNDAVGIAGVDIAAEEELARSQSTIYRNANRHHSTQSQQPWMKSPRIKMSDFLDKPALTLMVQHIAASFQLKTLEPAILDVLTQAAEARLHSLIADSIAVKDHRVASCHLRPPPLYPTSPPKGKQKEKEPEAMYDQLVYDRPERILSMLARVEGEEERKARLERESSEIDDGSNNTTAGTSYNKDSSQQISSSNNNNNSTGSSNIHSNNTSELNRSGYPSEQVDKLGQARKEKKRKREGPGQQARNMSEDARARQSNQTALRSVGGRSKYSWLSGGVVSNNHSTNTNRGISTNNAIMASLPAPKFAPQVPNSTSNQDTPSATTTTGLTRTSNTTTQHLNHRTIGMGGSKKDFHHHHQSSSNSNNNSNRLGGLIPIKHISHQSNQVGLNDCLFALERERGTGAGKGTGIKTVFKSYLIGNQPTFPYSHHSHHPHQTSTTNLSSNQSQSSHLQNQSHPLNSSVSNSNLNRK